MKTRFFLSACAVITCLYLISCEREVEDIVACLQVEGCELNPDGTNSKAQIEIDSVTVDGNLPEID